MIAMPDIGVFPSPLSFKVAPPPKSDNCEYEGRGGHIVFEGELWGGGVSTMSKALESTWYVKFQTYYSTFFFLMIPFHINLWVFC